MSPIDLCHLGDYKRDVLDSELELAFWRNFYRLPFTSSGRPSRSHIAHAIYRRAHTYVLVPEQWKEDIFFQTEAIPISIARTEIQMFPVM